MEMLSIAGVNRPSDYDIRDRCYRTPQRSHQTKAKTGGGAGANLVSNKEIDKNETGL